MTGGGRRGEGDEVRRGTTARDGRGEEELIALLLGGLDLLDEVGDGLEEICRGRRVSPRPLALTRSSSRQRVSSGSAAKEDGPATRPTSATWKIGASASCGERERDSVSVARFNESFPARRAATGQRLTGTKEGRTLLMATIVFESFMPAKCWIAPEMPTAMYRFGAMTLPVWPTCSEFSAYPLSTAARLAPMAAPSASASGMMVESNDSLDLTPRPPETTVGADDRSGRSDLTSSSEIHCDCSAMRIEDRAPSGRALEERERDGEPAMSESTHLVRRSRPLRRRRCSRSRSAVRAPRSRRAP